MPLARASAALLIAFGLAAPIAAAAPTKKAPAKPALAKPTPPQVTGNVTRAQMMAQVKKTFMLADTNHDGFISRAEFAARMAVVLNRDAPPTKEDAQRMLDAANNAFNNVDTNHDGKLSLSEASVRPLRAFDMMDTNHDGILTVAEKAAAHEGAPELPYGPSGGPTVGQQQGPGR